MDVPLKFEASVDVAVHAGGAVHMSTGGSCAVTFSPLGGVPVAVATLLTLPILLLLQRFI